MARCFALALALLISWPALAQPADTTATGPEGVLQIGDDLSRFLLRQQTLGHLSRPKLASQPLSAYEARRLLDSLALRGDRLTSTDRHLLARFRREAEGPGVRFVRGFAPALYQDGSSFLSLRGDTYSVEVQPLAYLSLGRARRTVEGETETISYWQNTRGARAGGRIGRYLFFEGNLTENQWLIPFNERAINTAPRLPFVRNLDGAYDYMLSTGLIGVTTEHIEVRFGRDRNLWSGGRTSVALAPFAPNYDQLQIRTQFGPVSYTNLYAEFVDRIRTRGDLLLPRKYGSFHRLIVDLPFGFEAELYESVIFAQDTTGTQGRRGFDLAYLNPVILYRAVEGDLGSPDNMFVGTGLSWNAPENRFGGLRLYSQLVLTEFSASRIFSEDWWGNKWAYQLGARIADPLGVPDLDLQIEYARLRPFMYAHRALETAFVHQNDVLGHPAGPNAWDLGLFAEYRPLPELTAALDVAFTRRGRNPDSLNFGADPTLSYNTRPRDRDRNTTFLQGVREDYLLVEGRVGYELLPSLIAEAALRVESWNDAETGIRRYVAPYATLRWGLPYQSVRY